MASEAATASAGADTTENVVVISEQDDVFMITELSESSIVDDFTISESYEPVSLEEEKVKVEVTQSTTVIKGGSEKATEVIEKKPIRKEVKAKPEKKDKKKKVGASLRARKSVNYSDERLDQEEEESNNKEFEEEQNAAIASGLRPAQMTPLELREMPEFVGQGNYFEIRNHILARWHQRVNQYLAKNTAVERIQAQFRKLAGRIFEFLERYGYINIGCFEVPEGVTTQDGSEKAQERQKRRVVVVGAGMAGLAAARQLKHLGYTVVVVEGRDRVGGRAFTDFSTFNGAVDLGGSIITGLEGNPLTILCKQLNLKLHRLSLDCPLYDINGFPVPEDIDRRMEALFNAFLDQSVTYKKTNTPVKSSSDQVASAWPEGCGTSLGLTIDHIISKQDPPLTALERQVLDWHVANLEYACATDLANVDLHEWDQDDQYEFPGDHCMLPTGYGSVAKALAEGLDIRFGKPVSHVHYSTNSNTKSEGEQTKVTFADGEEIEADAVLITVPLGVLKEGTIKFTPALPDWKSTAIERLGFGLLNKVVMLFPYPFWNAELDYFGIVQSTTPSRGEGYLFWNLHRVMGQPVLVSLVAGAASWGVEDANSKDSDVVARVVTALRAKFGESTVPEPEKSVVTHWHSEPLSRGSYSYIAIGSSGADYDILARSVGNLYFAGEATIREHPATIAGAFLSGLRESGNIDRDACSVVEQREMRDTSVARISYSTAAEGNKSARSKVGGTKRKYMSSESLEWLFVQSYRIPKKLKVPKPPKEKKEDTPTKSAAQQVNIKRDPFERPRDKQRDLNRSRDSLDRSRDSSDQDNNKSRDRNRDLNRSWDKDSGTDSWNRRDKEYDNNNRGGLNRSGGERGRGRGSGWDNRDNNNRYNNNNRNANNSAQSDKMDLTNESGGSNSGNNNNWSNNGNNYNNSKNQNTAWDSGRNNDNYGGGGGNNDNYDSWNNPVGNNDNYDSWNNPVGNNDSWNNQGRRNTKWDRDEGGVATAIAGGKVFNPAAYTVEEINRTNSQIHDPMAEGVANNYSYMAYPPLPPQQQQQQLQQYDYPIMQPGPDAYYHTHPQTVMYNYPINPPIPTPPPPGALPPPPPPVNTPPTTHQTPSTLTQQTPTTQTPQQPTQQPPTKKHKHDKQPKTGRFKDDVSDVVVKRLKKYQNAGRIRNTEDFRHLARKLTHQCVDKERRAHATVGATDVKMTNETKKKIYKYIDAFFGKLTGVYIHD